MSLLSQNFLLYADHRERQPFTKVSYRMKRSGQDDRQGKWGAWGHPVRIQRTPTNRYNNDVSVRDTIKILRSLARQYAGDPAVIEAVLEACGRLPDGAGDRETASAIFHWVRHKVRFVDDESLLYSEIGVRPEELDKELLIVPPALLRMPQPMGDCDDFSLLVASMTIAAGLRPFYVTVAADAGDPQKLSHIYVCVCLRDEDGFLCLDAGNRYTTVPPGWESTKVTRKAIWAI